jgi:hypothetical protein
VDITSLVTARLPLDRVEEGIPARRWADRPQGHGETGRGRRGRVTTASTHDTAGMVLHRESFALRYSQVFQAAIRSPTSRPCP